MIRRNPRWDEPDWDPYEEASGLIGTDDDDDQEDPWAAERYEPGELPPTREWTEETAREYANFRTGLTFGDVRRLLAIEQRQTRDFTGDYMFVSRSTVLGRWREIKMDMFGGAPPPSRDITCAECSDIVDLEEICADCGDCHECCSCELTPQDDFWRENPWGGTRWLLSDE